MTSERLLRLLGAIVMLIVVAAVTIVVNLVIVLFAPWGWRWGRFPKPKGPGKYPIQWNP